MARIKYLLCGLCRNRLVLVIIVTIFLFILSTILIPITNESSIDITLESFNQLANKDDFLRHTEDMHRLQKSIITELSKLEQKRNKLKAAVDALENSNKDADSQLRGMQKDIAQLKADVKNMLLTKDDVFKDYLSISLPTKLLPTLSEETSNASPKDQCTLQTCFDYSRCSLLSGFPLYLYPISTDDNVLLSIKTSILDSQHITDNPDIACMYMLIYDGSNTDMQSLPFWRGDGRNHIVINAVSSKHIFPKSRAVLAQIDFNEINRKIPGFDVSLPYLNLQPIDHNYLPLLLPVRREHLLFFRGKAPVNERTAGDGFIAALSSLSSSFLKVNITVQCSVSEDCLATEWCVCNDHKLAIGEKTSIFVMIPNVEKVSLEQFTYRIYIALVNGAIPVILGSHHEFPLAEVIPWDKVAITLPVQRVTELTFILRNVLEPDIMLYKKQGRLILENYLISIPKVISSLINLLRTRINIPPLPVKIPESTHIYNDNNPMTTFEVRVDTTNEILGPIEDSFPSPSYQRNFTSWVLSREDPNQMLFGTLFQHTPWDPILPTDAKYHGSPYGFRPINGGAGGSGKEFSESLGGNYQREQYTIVVLTYDRADLLQQQLAQFDGLPYLNKVLVIWNNPQLPPSSLQWPRIHVKIEVIKAQRNSLNNRFLPYKEIETEAVLSMDDDMYLRHDEIVFAFRVWRESRDRIVGFPGRYHAWNVNDQQWNYNSNHSCELSMILTGAAFFHKYYMYQYSYFMPQAIRDKVDDFMNCEDLAMNFLVSHITGKPPVKTTSRWTFRCPTCGEAALWIDESHFNERHQCIQYFTQVYGYLPLLYTQLRADSVLFKTRVPQEKSKCFTLV